MSDETGAAGSNGLVVSKPVAQLGIVELREIQRWLGLSHPTVTRLMRDAGVPFFRLGQRKCCRWVDLEPWLSSMATEGYLEGCAENEKHSSRPQQAGDMATAA
jgi:predicted DNA-binding transcriptional regulator AlpA